MKTKSNNSTHLDSRVFELESMLSTVQSALSSAQERIALLEKQNADLRVAYDALLEELRLLKRRIFIAKAERVDTTQLTLDFQDVLHRLDLVAGTLGIPGDHRKTDPTDEPLPLTNPAGGAGNDGNKGTASPKKTHRPKGRRDLSELDYPEQRIELTDPVFETLVAEGKAVRFGFEESYKLGWQKPGPVRVVIARAKYKTVDRYGESAVETTPIPAEALIRSLAAPSMLAHVLVSKYSDGLPFNRLETIVDRHGLRLDRGTMCRWADELGALFAVTIVEAMRKEAFATAFCLAADATGIPVQPVRRPDSKRQPCYRGHYYVFIADKDHIWFEYAERDNSETVERMFKGYVGYVQVDAKSVFDVLFREEGEKPANNLEVGCWSHARRKFWEVSLSSCEIAREALARIHRLFEIDASWAGQPHRQIQHLRDIHLRPHVVSFFDWAQVQYDLVKNTRGSLRSALGYTVRQRTALSSFLNDGRLRLDNNPSELQLRGRVAVGRKAWLFVGSSAHAENAAGTMSLVASAKLHRLEPEAYLRDMIRVIPHWPRDRFIELAPKYWLATRARLDSTELATEVGSLTLPESPTVSSEQQAPSD